MRQNIPIDYDNNWKEVLMNMTPDFLEFFLPTLYADIDTTTAPVFLEQELFDTIQLNNTVVDKLLKVKLKNGEEKWVLVHIEFQTNSDKSFPQRMYEYYHGIRAKYRQNITAIAIYTGKSKPQIYDHYKEESYGTSNTYRFNTYIVAQQNEQDLLANPNPFAIVVLANYYVLKTQGNQATRLSLKEKIFEVANQRNYSHEKTVKLLFFINDLMRLNLKFTQAFKEYIQITYPNPSPAMFKYSQDTYDLVDIQTQALYGKTMPQLIAEAEKTKAEAEKTKAEAEKISSKLKTLIISLYTNSQMSVGEIARFCQEDPEAIRAMLVAEKIL